VTRRSDRRAGSRRRERDSAEAVAAAKPSGHTRPLLQHRAVQAGLLFGVLLVAYLANGDVLPGQDATGSVRLAGKLVSKHKITFSPEDDPFMFQWHLKTTKGEVPATFRAWASLNQGEPIRRAYERGELTRPLPFYYLMATRSHDVYVNRYGLGAGLFAVPFVAAVYPFATDLYDRPSASLLWHTAKVATACAVAGSAVFLFLAALAFVRPSTAACLALAYGLGTSVFSSSSQTLWQHGPTELFLALGTYLLLRENRRRLAPWVGLSYMLAFACRPTSAVAVIAAGGYYLIRDRRALVGFVVGCLPVAILLSAYNLHYFGKLLVFGQLGDLPSKPAVPPGNFEQAASTPGHEFRTSLLTGLAGILISPSRGLLVFSPAIGFALWGLLRAWRDPAFLPLRAVSVAAVVMCVLAARWYGWWGGWCYGYRLLVDAVTPLAFLAIPVAEEIRRRRILLATFAGAALWGIMVQAVGAFAYDVVGWNNRNFVAVKVGQNEPLLFADPDQASREAWARQGSTEEIRLDINSRPGRYRLWTIRDSQILYYLTHFQEARALKQYAIEQFLRERG
jgi:hypothetical protein